MPCVLTIGNFDGVHLGHQSLVDRVIQESGQRNIRSRALFFDPHPAAYFAKLKGHDVDKKPLTTPVRREELLLRAGLGAVVIEAFNDAYATQSPEDFVRAQLVEKLNVKAVVVGKDFRFGQGRAGDVDLLAELGKQYDFEAMIVPSVFDDSGEVISSTRVRQSLSDGDIDIATKLLGRFPDIDGTVVKGHQRGRTIGFPTANLDVDPTLLPSDGVYAVVGNIDGALFQGVANLGVRPTMAAGRSVEIHFFDFDRDIYGARVRTAFVGRIRDEKKFDGLPALVEQIKEDAKAARHMTESLSDENLQWI